MKYLKLNKKSTFARVNTSCSAIENKFHIKPTSILKFQNNMYT